MTDIVRARIGLGVHEEVTGNLEFTVAGIALYGYEQSGTTYLAADKFGARAPLSRTSVIENHVVIKETMRFVIDFFDKFEDPLAIQNLSNNKALEIMRDIDPTGKMTIMDAIRAGGLGYKIGERS